jgi:hypothetical protein
MRGTREVEPAFGGVAVCAARWFVAATDVSVIAIAAFTIECFMMETLF